MLVTKEIHAHIGHRVPNHKSKCRNLHGHTYRIEVGVDDKIVTTKGTSDEGMVIDFGDIKKIMVEEIYNIYDHGFVLYDMDKLKPMFDGMAEAMGIDRIIYVPFIPTAENFAKRWYEMLKQRFEEIGITLFHVKVWETPTSTAEYNAFDDKKDSEGKIPDNQERLQK